MKSILAIAGILAASITAASAANQNLTTVGVVNTNGHTILDATGSISNTAFASDIGTAFANNTGGVWNFDTAFSQVTVNDTITLSYGTAQSQSLVLTLTSGSDINQAVTNTGEQTSASDGLGLVSDASTRVFTPSTSLLSVGVFVGNRGDNARTSVLTVTFLDNTMASTSGANAGPGSNTNYFEGITGTALNPIKSFSLTQNAFVRYDDLGFKVVPEPTTATMLTGGLGMLTLMRRRRAANRG